MPKYSIEATSGDGQQYVVDARDETAAVKEFLYRHQSLGLLLTEYDDDSDPHNRYHRDAEQTWQHITISVSPPSYECKHPKCEELVQEEDEECGDCTFECEHCGRDFDLSEQGAKEWVCKGCVPVTQEKN